MTYTDHDDQFGYDPDPLDGYEPDPSDYYEREAEAAYWAMPWPARKWSDVCNWWWCVRSARRGRREWRRIHRQQHPGVPVAECPDEWHGNPPPF